MADEYPETIIEPTETGECEFDVADSLYSELAVKVEPADPDVENALQVGGDTVAYLYSTAGGTVTIVAPRTKDGNPITQGSVTIADQELTIEASTQAAPYRVRFHSVYQNGLGLVNVVATGTVMIALVRRTVGGI